MESIMMETEKFRLLFEQEKSTLLQRHLAASSFETPDAAGADDLDVAGAVLERVMSQRLKNREALYFAKIEGALERIRMGTFGRCLECGGQIEMRRLEARPTATHCVACKEVQESKEGQTIQGRKSKSWSEGVVLRRTA